MDMVVRRCSITMSIFHCLKGVFYEVLQERAVIDDLIYYQQCRTALERCLENKSSALRYKRQDGTMRTVSFQRMSLGRVKILGLV